MRSCKEVNLEPYGTFSDFFVKYKIALKEHVPYKYRDIWKILDKKAAQKPYQGNIYWMLIRLKWSKFWCF